jgi:hypothetical protein
MIKTKSAAAVAAAFLLSVTFLRAETVRSPDGQFALEVGRGVEVVDASGQPVLTLVPALNGSRKVEASWSGDSRRVVVVTNAARGSAVMAAWREGSAWHKALQPDSDPGWDRLVRGKGRLVSEQRSIGGWISPDSVLVLGELDFSVGRRSTYRYTLTFVPSSAGLNRGGFEEGALVGANYK